MFPLVVVLSMKWHREVFIFDDLNQANAIFFARFLWNENKVL